MKQDEFFIGWQGELPHRYKGVIRGAIIVIFAVMIAVAAIFSFSENGFIDSVFEYGELTTHEGIIRLKPVPTLQVTSPDESIKEMVLIGAFKFGAMPTILDWEEENGKKLDGKLVELRGTLIYYDDFSLLELTEGSASILSVTESKKSTPSRKELGKKLLTGEIIDVKCFFGAMNPGSGKIHKSCGIRCIDGGIPSGFKTVDDQYYILTLPEHIKGVDLFVYTGQLIQIEGESVQIGEIKYFTPTNSNIKEIAQILPIDSYLAACSSNNGSEIN